MSRIEVLTRTAGKVPARLGWDAFRLGLKARRWLWDVRKDPGEVDKFRQGELWRSQRSWESDVPKTLLARADVSLPAQTPEARAHLVRVEDAYLEPKCGYAILPPGTLLDQSLPFSEMPRFWSRMHMFSGLPSFRHFNAVVRGKAPVQRVRCAVSLRHPFDYNYYHFTVDVMTRLELLAQQGVGHDAVLVVSPQLAKQAFFKAAVERPELSRRKWLVQEDFIRAEELLIAKPLDGGTASGIKHYLDLLGVAPPSSQGTLKLFLDRATHRGRSASNRAELLPIIERAGFTLVDADRLSLMEQAELFSRCSHLAGFHGAGLTNMIFRREEPLQVLEVFPPRETSLEYQLLAKRLGYAYRYMRGERSEGRERNANFTIDAATLASFLSGDSGLPVAIDA